MRTIDVDEAIINFGFEWDDIPPTREEFVRFLKKQPTVDAVPVVRCRECKYSSYDEIFGNRWCNSHLGCRKVKDDGYCYLGERKEGAD